jgi:plasmid stabilization system protein ParE
VFTIIVTSQARRQLETISAWWRTHRPEAPDQFDRVLRALFESLRQFPERGRAVSSTHRRLVATTGHVVIYRVRPRAKTVGIITVRPP